MKRWISVMGMMLMVLSASACGNQEPVRIIITPTAAPITPSPEQTQSVSASASPTLMTDITAEVQVTVMPVIVAAVSSETPLSASHTPLPSATPAGDGQFMGSVLGGAVQIPSTMPTLETLPETPTDVPTTPAPTPEPSVEPMPVVSAPALDMQDMGIQVYYNMGPDDFGQVVYLVNQMRFGWIKFQVDWSFWQPNAPDEVNETFLNFEQHIQLAKNRGLRVLLSVAKAPQWARGTDQNEAGPPDDPQALANFMRLLIQRVKPENIDAIEIWNEPNLAREWRGALPFNGAGYMQLFAPAYAVIRQEDPDSLIITAGLAPTGNTETSVNDRDYLQQMFDAGLGQYEGVAVGVHPYGWANAPDAMCCDPSDARGWDDDPHFFFLNNLNDTREIMVRNGYEGRQMWTTEFGWATWANFPNSAPEPWMAELSPEQQAEYVIRAFQIGMEREDMGPMFLWNFNFANRERVENGEEISAYSIFVPNFGGGDPLAKRPLFDALVNRP